MRKPALPIEISVLPVHLNLNPHIVNIPYPSVIVRYVRELYAGSFIPAMNGILNNRALFVHCLMASAEFDCDGFSSGADQPFNYCAVY